MRDMPRLLARQSDPTSSYAQPTLFPLIPAPCALRPLRLGPLVATATYLAKPRYQLIAKATYLRLRLRFSTPCQPTHAPDGTPKHHPMNRTLGGSQKCLRLDLDFSQLRGRNAFGKVEHLVAAATYLRPPRRTPVQCKCLLPCIFGSYPGALGAVPLSAG